jgi:hypothetical protein
MSLNFKLVPRGPRLERTWSEVKNMEGRREKRLEITSDGDIVIYNTISIR